MHSFKLCEDDGGATFTSEYFLHHWLHFHNHFLEQQPSERRSGRCLVGLMIGSLHALLPWSRSGSFDGGCTVRAAGGRGGGVRDHWGTSAWQLQSSPFKTCRRRRVSSYFRKANRPQQENKIFARLNDGRAGDMHGLGGENSWWLWSLFSQTQWQLYATGGGCVCDAGMLNTGGMLFIFTNTTKHPYSMTHVWGYPHTRTHRAAWSSAPLSLSNLW